MSLYQFSGSESGPWIAFDGYETPAAAFNVAKARFEWPVIYIAEMRSMNAADLLGQPHVFWSDVEERVAMNHGNSKVEELSNHKNELLYETYEAMTERMYNIGLLVGGKVVAYLRDAKLPRETDFTGETMPAIDEPRKPNLEDLLP